MGDYFKEEDDEDEIVEGEEEDEGEEEVDELKIKYKGVQEIIDKRNNIMKEISVKKKRY